MSSTSRLQRVSRSLWHTTAGLLVLLALLLTLLRLLLPGLMASNHQAIEAFAGRLLGQPLEIETMSLRMRGLQLELVFRDVRLLDAAGGRVIARFDSAASGIKLMASLVQRQPMLDSLIVKGVTLLVVREEDGRIAIQGLQGKPNRPGTASGMGQWLLAQGNLTLQESRLHWNDLKTGRQLDFSHVDIHLRNRGKHHQLDADIRLPPDLGEAVHLNMDVQGDLLAGSNWSGRAYLQGRGLQTAFWAEERDWLPELSLQQGVIDFRLWGEWNEGRLASLDVHADARDMELVNGRAALQLSRAAMQAHWQQLEQGWKLWVHDLHLHGQEGVSSTPAQLLVEKNDVVDVQVGWLQLRELAAIAALLPVLDAGQKDALAVLQPRGMLQSGRFRFDDAGHLQHAQGLLEQGGAEAWEKFPAISNLQLDWVWDGETGHARLDSERATVEFPRLFRRALNIGQASALLGLHRSADGWKLAVRELQAGNADVHVEAGMQLDLPAGGDPVLYLQGDFRDADAQAVSGYLPAGIMNGAAVQWLDAAFSQGHVPYGTVYFHGPLPAFPFDRDEGHFAVAFLAEDTSLFFHPAWPELSAVRAGVYFHNRSMDIHATDGRIYSSAIGATHVRIANLHAPLLEVRGEVEVSGDDGLRLLRETPLREQLGESIANLRLEGSSRLKLGFVLPLMQEDVVAQEGTDGLVVDGVVELSGNRLQVGERLPIEEISGPLYFSHQGISSTGLQAKLLQGPARVRIRTEEGGGARGRTIISAQGTFFPQALEDVLENDLFSYLQGSSKWFGTLVIPHAERGAELRVNSALQGISSQLPGPLYKESSKKVALALVHRFSGPWRGQLALQYGEELAAALALDGEGSIRRGALYFGRGQAVLPDTDIWQVRGTVAGVVLADWQRLASGGTGKSSTLLPVHLQMDEVRILPGNEEERVERVSPAGQFPDLDLSIDRLFYADELLGNFSLHLHNQPGQVVLDRLALQGEFLQLAGTAHWQTRPASRTTASLNMESADFGRLLKTFRIASSISAGKANISGEYHWPGSLGDFSLAALEGRVQVDIRDGKLDEIKPGAGRLLGLLSLQALPRRLLLDFRDMFEQGLPFTRVKADVSLEGGNAHTSNLLMNTAVAEIRVDGRTGLVERDYDQHITVVPNVSDSAPLVSTLAFGPQVGAAVLLFQQLLRKNLNEATKSEYHVTGSWENPQVRKWLDTDLAEPADAS